MIRTERALGPVLIAALLVAPLVARAGEHSHAGHAHAAPPATAAEPSEADATLVAKQRASYPLTTCPVSGEELGSMGDPVDYVHDGRLVRFCCPSCEERFLADPAKYLAKVDEAVIAAQRDSYPLATCPISGMKLGGMGEPYDHVHGTRLVRFCCGNCLPKFRADPEAAMAKVDEALMEAQRAAYSATTCPVTPDKSLDAMGDPHDILYGTRLVRLCCEACVGEFWKDPERYLAVLDVAPVE